MQALTGETYDFQARPQVVRPKAKYRQEEDVKLSPDMEDLSQLPANIMFDKRVVRGNTYAASVIQKGQDELKKKTLLKSNKIFKKPTLKSTQGGQQTQQQFQANVSTPRAVANRHHIDMQTDDYIETLADKPPEQEVDVQTDFYIDKPPDRLFNPRKWGVDKETQIWEGELFDFDSEVEPILQVLMNKILEQSRMEVLEEEELKLMKQQQKQFEKTRNAELAEMQRLDAIQQRLDSEDVYSIIINYKQRRKLQYETVRNLQISSHRKLTSRLIAKDYLKFLKESTFIRMEDLGVFRNPLKAAIYADYIPWLHSKVFNELLDADAVENQFGGSNCNNNLIALLDSITDENQFIHQAALDNEQKRKNHIFAERERIKQEKIQMKRKKEEERQRQLEKQKREELRGTLMHLQDCSDRLLNEFNQRGEIKPLIIDADHPLPEHVNEFMNLALELSTYCNSAAVLAKENNEEFAFRSFFRQDLVQLQNQLFFFFIFLFRFDDHLSVRDYLMEELREIGIESFQQDQVPAINLDLIKLLMGQLFSPLLQIMIERKIKEINVNPADQDKLLQPFKNILEDKQKLLQNINFLHVEEVQQDPE